MNFINQLLKSETDNTYQMMLQDFSPSTFVDNLISAFLWMCQVHVDILVASRQAIFVGLDADYSKYQVKLDRIVSGLETLTKRFGDHVSSKRSKEELTAD